MISRDTGTFLGWTQTREKVVLVRGSLHLRGVGKSRSNLAFFQICWLCRSDYYIGLCGPVS